MRFSLNSLPRPTRVTAIIAAVAVAMIAVVYVFLYRPNGSELSKAQDDIRAAEIALDKVQEKLSSYKTGEALDTGEIDTAISGLDDLLPPPTTDTGPIFSQIADRARAAGLSVDRVEVPAGYEKPGGAESFPDLLVASGKIAVTGSISNLSTFLESLNTLPQIVTYLPDSVANVNTIPKTVVGINLWASTKPALTP